MSDTTLWGNFERHIIYIKFYSDHHLFSYRCWLSAKDGMIYVFAVPTGIVVMVNKKLGCVILIIPECISLDQYFHCHSSCESRNKHITTSYQTFNRYR